MEQTEWESEKRKMETRLRALEWARGDWECERVQLQARLRALEWARIESPSDASSEEIHADDVGVVESETPLASQIGSISLASSCSTISMAEDEDRNKDKFTHVVRALSQDACM